MYRTFIPSIKYIKKIDVRIIKFDISYLGPDRWEAHMGISTAERLRSFKRRTSHVPNLMHKLLRFIFTCEHFIPLNIMKMNWVRLIKFYIWINRRMTYHLGRPY